MTLKTGRIDEASVGPFYAIGGRLVFDVKPLSRADRQGDDVSSNLTHYEQWKPLFESFRKKNPDFNITDHEFCPRGRVIYNIKEDIYYLLIDRCIKKSKKMMTEIFSKMNLPKKKTKVTTDFHYKCAKCRAQHEGSD